MRRVRAAGAMGAVAGSPMPPGASLLGTTKRKDGKLEVTTGLQAYDSAGNVVWDRSDLTQEEVRAVARSAQSLLRDSLLPPALVSTVAGLALLVALEAWRQRPAAAVEPPAENSEDGD